MAEAPKVIVIEDPSGPVQAGVGGLFPVVYLGESADGPSLNEDGVLVQITSSRDIGKWLGPPSFANPWPDVLQAHLDMCSTPCLFGRVTGAGGVKASVNLPDQAITPATTASLTWRGPSALPSRAGAQYRVRVSRGRSSTADTGAGRVDTKLELLSPVGSVLAALDECSLNPALERYAPTLWNALGAPCTLADASPNDSYESADEPAVGTYNFAGGVDPAAATSTERQAAANALEGAEAARFGLVGVVGWGAAELNVLAGHATANLWVVIAHLSEAATPATAALLEADLTVGRDRIALHAGWGSWYRNPAKSIPGLPQVMADAVKAARFGGGLLVSLTGANTPEDRWISFEPLAPDREGFAAERTNPLYRKPAGVVVGDVLSLSTRAPYTQWGSRRAVDLVLRDVLAYLNDTVLLNINYPFARTTTPNAGVVNNSTFARIDAEIAVLFAQYPVGLLAGGRGVGWDWAAEGVVNGADGPEPVWLLGVAPAQVARLATLKIGLVEGRFALAVAAAPGVVA